MRAAARVGAVTGAVASVLARQCPGVAWGRDDRVPHADRYEISSVEKVGPDLWRFNARMDCCGVTGAIPVVVPMRWIGDTPVIMMTDTSLPAVGTFTVRLFFYLSLI